MSPPSFAWAVVIGLVWFTLTVCFEFVGGHYFLHKPWRVLLDDHSVARGHLWVLVLVTTLAAPPLVHWLSQRNAG